MLADSLTSPLRSTTLTSIWLLFDDVDNQLSLSRRPWEAFAIVAAVAGEVRSVVAAATSAFDVDSRALLDQLFALLGSAHSS
jgi:hypothetical protein